jgi:hypothetical protein
MLERKRLVSSPLVARDFMADRTEQNVSPIYLISTYIFVFCIFDSQFTTQNKGGGIHVSILLVIYLFMFWDMLNHQQCSRQ